MEVGRGTRLHCVVVMVITRELRVEAVLYHASHLILAEGFNGLHVVLTCVQYNVTAAVSQEEKGYCRRKQTGTDSKGRG